ncbi:MAG: hypothetical protein ABSF56_00140 [Minisyncoccia bacterium]|jgi:uncharacterized membrane protein
MKNRLYWLLGLSIAGLLFSGYLSGVKLMTNSCALGESCPYFLGYPACLYGFAMYLIMTVAAIWALAVPAERARNPLTTIATVSFLGIIFAGSFVVQEVSSWIGLGHIIPYTLGLPSCAYGLVFYIAIFVVSVLSLRRRE